MNKHLTFYKACHKAHRKPKFVPPFYILMNRIYQLSTCDTCRRILKETGTSGFEVIDIKQQHIDSKSLDAIAKKTGSYESLFNKRAQKFKLIGKSKLNYTEAEWRALILSDYTFLKRPIYIIDNEVFAGNTTATVEAIKNKLNEHAG